MANWSTNLEPWTQISHPQLLNSGPNPQAKDIDQVSQQCISVLKNYHQALSEKLSNQAGVNLSHLTRIKNVVEASAASKLKVFIEDAQTLTQQAQKESSRTIVPLIQDLMSGGYSRGFEERGSGSGARRSMIVENHLAKQKDVMFGKAVHKVLEHLRSLSSTLKALFQKTLVGLAKDFLNHYSEIWSEQANSPQAERARQLISREIQASVHETRTSWQKLLAVHGDWQTAEDDDIKEVHENQVETEVIDLTDDSDYVPKPVKVKSEKVAEDQVTVVVLGGTGAGKSTLLNAILGEESILPTNAMRACTATIIEIVWDEASGAEEKFCAEIEFISSEEWETELQCLFRALKSGGEGVKIPEEGTAQHETFDRVKTAYGMPPTLYSLIRAAPVLKFKTTRLCGGHPCRN